MRKVAAQKRGTDGRPAHAGASSGRRGENMSEVTLERLNKHYGETQHAVKDVDLTIADQEFVALVGPRPSRHAGSRRSACSAALASLQTYSRRVGRSTHRRVPGGRPCLSFARLLCRIRHQRRTLSERPRNVLALAGDGLDHGVGEGLVHPRPFLEVVRATNLVRHVQAHLLQLAHEGILLGDLLPEGLVWRRRAGGLPQRDLPGFVLHHVREHLLGELLALAGYGLGNGPAPDVVPTHMSLPIPSERAVPSIDLAGHLIL